MCQTNGDVRAELNSQIDDKKTKMLVVHHSFSPCGGAETFLLNFLSLFPLNLYQIDILLFDGNQGDANMFDAIPSGINILPFLNQYSTWSPELMDTLRTSGNVRAAEIKDFIHFRNISEDFKKLPKGIRFDENWKLLKTLCPHYAGYDIAVAFENILALRIAAENVSAEKKFVFIHGDPKGMIESKLYDESYFRCEYPLYKQMTGIVCITDQNAASFCALFPDLSNKVSVLKNVNNVAAIRIKATAFYPPEYHQDRFTILTVARVSPGKAIELLLKSAHVLKVRGFVFNWFILGNDLFDDYSKKCHDLHEELSLEDCVFFLGARPNPFPYYKNCDLYAHISLYEGRPLAIEEAMVLNCPIIATNFPSVTDQITDGVNGLICEKDPDGIATTIAALYHNADERKRLAESNTHYSGEATKEQYLRYFR